MAEVVETFRMKFMESVAGIANRMAGVCAGLVATPDDMVPHDMELERLIGGVLDGLSAAAVAAVTAAAALDDSGMATASRRSPSRTDAELPPCSSCMATPSD